MKKYRIIKDEFDAEFNRTNPHWLVEIREGKRWHTFLKCYTRRDARLMCALLNEKA